MSPNPNDSNRAPDDYLEDPAFIRQFQGRESAAWESLYRDAEVNALCHRYLPSVDPCELKHIALLEFWTRIFGPPQKSYRKLLNWIVKNRGIDLWRRENRQRSITFSDLISQLRKEEGSELDFVSDLLGSRPEPIFQDILEIVEIIFEEMGAECETRPNCRCRLRKVCQCPQLLQDRFVNGRTLEEIATDRETPLSTVKDALRRCLEELRIRLKKHGIFGSEDAI